MSMSSSLFRQREMDSSCDIEDLRSQNQSLLQENLTLKKSLEELIAINTELTESIEEFNNSHIDNFPNINQNQIEQLAHQVIQLQEELDRERKNRDNYIKIQEEEGQKASQLEEVLKVIQEIIKQFSEVRTNYEEDLSRITNDLIQQKEQFTKMYDGIQEKLSKFQLEYIKLLQDTKKKQAVIKALEIDLQQKGRGQMSKKQMKISTTIEDLRTTLQRQIEQKDKIIRSYENLIESIKTRLNEKISL